MNRTRRHSYPRVLAIVAGLLAVLVVAVLLLGGSGDDGYTVRAEFKDTAGLRKNSDVKIGGVPAGRSPRSR